MTSVPNPPWRKTRKPVKPPLSQEAIVDVGLRIVDAEGLDGLSMRRVAQELDTGPASLYAHVSNKDELIELIYEKVLGEIVLPEADPANWQEQLRAYARQAHAVIAAHADLSKATLAKIPTGPNALRLGEYMYGLLIEAGLPPLDASLGMDRISLYIASDAFEGSQHYAHMRAAGITSPDDYMKHLLEQIGGYYRSLPPEMFPYMTGNLDALVEPNGEDRFEFGLDLLIAGLEMRLARMRESF
ncbi:TetR/AcrR family transcriptional regulator C-terminal domain-containing protein [Nonomuraea sp. NBC_01738]|uniref:TetR/AcrR family transcriptional regulator C-terminal domain-containing protein n=1 Tax=Nonomuraea sp. NBC_01738 TaxID=2976003 RepID=UPI002E1603DB|nr:TetR/AcrR family transcriptional regulator C-terminal domain-containing protein [Nonomuraea sp. NBC_01738]